MCTFMAALAAMPLTDATAAFRGGGGGRTVNAPVFRAPVNRQFQSRAPAFRPNVVNRPVQHFTPSHRFTPSVNSGAGQTGCRHCGQQRHHPVVTNNPPNHPPHPGPGVIANPNPHPGGTQPPKPGQGFFHQAGIVHTLNHGPGKPISLKPTVKPAFPVINIQNKHWPLLKGPKFLWLAGRRHFFVPVGLLGVTLIGGSYWYPDGYVSIAGPLCTGFTPDGCQLEWRMVSFEDGGEAAQCVQYCQQAGPPPPQVVTLPPPPELVQDGVCQVTIYENPQFAGLAAPTTANQPILSDTGWKDEIASVQVQSGTWDFFSAENFGGETIRMAPGSYPMLTPEWNKRIGSFMCIEPAPSGT
jgi:hypothetical protein